MKKLKSFINAVWADTVNDPDHPFPLLFYVGCLVLLSLVGYTVWTGPSAEVKAQHKQERAVQARQRQKAEAEKLAIRKAAEAAKRAAPAPRVREIDKRFSVWTVVDVRRSSSLTAVESGRASNTVAGAVSGTGAAILAAAGPVGLVGGAMMGAGAGAAMPRTVGTAEEASCWIRMTASDETYENLFINYQGNWSYSPRHHQNTLNCSMAKVGDRMSLERQPDGNGAYVDTLKLLGSPTG